MIEILKYFDPRFKDRLIKLDTFSSNLIRLELNENGFLSPLQKKIDREKRVQLSRLSYSSTNLRKSEGSVLCLTKGNCKIRGANSTGNVDPIPRPFDRSLFSPSTNADCRSKPGNNRSTIDRPSTHARAKVSLLVGHSTPVKPFWLANQTDNLVSFDFSAESGFDGSLSLSFVPLADA